MIEKAMKECHVALKPNRNAKQQVRISGGKTPLTEKTPIN